LINGITKEYTIPATTTARRTNMVTVSRFAIALPIEIARISGL
jgi:hypothetical protein